MRSAVVFGGLLSVIVLFSSSAMANEAKDAFNEGNALYKKGQYSQAAEAYRRANALQPNWKIEYNIGQCEALAKRPGLALQAFERYLAQGGDDIPEKRRAEVTEEVLRLRTLVGFVEVTAPDGAVVYVGDTEIGKAPLPGAIPVAASLEHRIKATLNGVVIGEKAVIVSGGQTATADLTPVETAPPVAETLPEKTEESPLPAAPPKPDRTMKNLGWTAVISGGAMLIAGAITGALAASKGAELEESCPDDICTGGQSDQDLARSVDHLALATDILLPVGGALAITGTVLLIVASKREKSVSKTSLSPRIGPESAFIILEGRF